VADVTDQLNTSLADRYRIQRELGRGGMATVFLAEDLRHHRPVAIKVLHPELAHALGPERFLREIEVASRLTHPHILPVHDSGSANGLLFYVMPYVEGESLRQRLEREKQLPLADALRLAREVADALDYAHRRGVVHRDIKPENILLAEQHAVVADFGIARAIVAAGGAKLTTTGVMIGTPTYLSPEQAAGSEDLDGRSDLYGLGCVLYEMLAGQPPFTGPTAESLAYQHLSVAARPVTDLRPAVPEAVARTIHRTLAKAAADRFSTAAEFAAALATVTEPVAAGPRPESDDERAQGAELSVRGRGASPPGNHTRSLALTVAVVLALVAVAAWQRWGPFERWRGGSSSAHVAKKDWILVAEFDGPADDSSLAVTTRDLVSAALDQSEIVATVPRDQIRLRLEQAGKPARTRVDAEVARELAYRSSVRAVVEGTIGRLGSGYSVVLRVVDVDSARAILTQSAVAKNQDALIPTLGRLAEKLRAGLGEKRSSIQTTRRLTEAPTPSFEAYRLAVRGEELVWSGASQEAIPILRDALALDPDFAYAWRILAFALGNTGQMDSSRVAFDEALRRPQRLTTVERLGIEGHRAFTNGDFPGALAAYERVLREDPTNILILLTRGNVLVQLGRFEEALESLRMSERASPFGATQVHRENEFYYLCFLGRWEEAREITRYLRWPNGPDARGIVEAAAGHWEAVESIADTLLANPALDDDWRPGILGALAAAQAARGALRTAAATYERSEEVARGAGERILWWQPRARLMLAIVSDGAIPLPADTWVRDTSTATLLTRGLRAAIAGDQAGAQRLLNAARTRSRLELARQGATPALLEARIEGLAGRWEEAARILRPIASQPVEIGGVPYSAGMSAVRWSLADAFEQLGQPDSAAVALERIVSEPASAIQEPWRLGIAFPFAHRRLVLLYARMGRIEDAKRHWKIFSETLRTPDPELRPLIEEARAVLMSAEGMARSTRR
ncbi:MAG: protein kinase, partial [Candidatus Eisenbacteria bacterium]